MAGKTVNRQQMVNSILCHVFFSPIMNLRLLFSLSIFFFSVYTNAQYKYFNQPIEPGQIADINSDSLEKALKGSSLLSYSCSTDLILGDSLIESNILILTIPAGTFVYFPRYMDELDIICKEYHLQIEHEQVQIEKTTRRCLYELMDLTLAKMYGTNIKRRIHEKADSLYEVKSSTNYATYWECDTWPKLPEDSVRNHYIFNVQVNDTAFDLSGNWQTWPKVKIGIFLSSNGKMEKIVLEEYLPGTPENAELKDKAFQIVKSDFTNKYKRWSPCMIGGNPVKSFLMVEYYLKPL